MTALIMEEIVWDNIDKSKLILNRWLKRDLTNFGRVLLSKNGFFV